MTFIGKLRALLSKREKQYMIFLLVISIFVSFLETFSISLIMVFATLATNFEMIFKNKYFFKAYKILNCQSPSQFVILFGLFLIAFYLFRGVVLSLFNYSVSRFSQGRFRKFAAKFFENYLYFGYKDFVTSNSSKISTIIFSDAGQLSYIVLGIINICAESLTVLFIYLTLLWVNWKMTAVLTVLLAVKIFFIIKAFSNKLATAGKRAYSLNIELSKTFGESFGNFKLIKLLSNQKNVLKRFEMAALKVMNANTLNTMLQNSPKIILETMGFSILIAVIIYVLYRYNNAASVIPVVSMYAFAFYRFLPSMNKILSEYNRIIFSKHSLDNIHSYLTYDLENFGDESIKFDNKIKLQNISFAYNEKSLILDDVSFEIKKGQRTAFIGESGVGKSTIVDVIMGLYKPTKGTIFIDDKKIDESNVKSWRFKIGYIPQQIYLFDGTVAENIIFGREYNEQKLIEILKKVNLYDFLLSQNNGIHSKAGEGGVMLSGGQKQRIAIARALYSDPEILVLDEATSALDHETESKIMDEIYSLNKDKTLIIIAHRLTTVERCETIYKMEKGKVRLVTDLYGLSKHTAIFEEESIES